MTEPLPAHELITTGPLPYLLSAPPGSSPDAAGWPVLVFLHGHDEAAPTDIHRALTRHGPLRPQSWPEIRRRAVVIAPQLRRGGDIWHRHAAAVAEILEAVQRALGGDPRRSYLAGFSFGGNGVLDLALLQRETWAALWAVDPTRVPHADPGRPVWISFGEIARTHAREFTSMLSLRDVTEEYAPEGDRCSTDSGDDHVGAATRAFADARVYHWLLARRLPDVPAGA